MLKRPSPWRRNPAGLYRPLLRVSLYKKLIVFKSFKRLRNLKLIFKQKSKRTRNPSMAWQAGASRSRATCTRMTRPNRPAISSWKARANLPQSPQALSPVWVMAHSHEFILFFSNLQFNLFNVWLSFIQKTDHSSSVHVTGMTSMLTSVLYLSAAILPSS